MRILALTLVAIVVLSAAAFAADKRANCDCQCASAIGKHIQGSAVDVHGAIRYRTQFDASRFNDLSQRLDFALGFCTDIGPGTQLLVEIGSDNFGPDTNFIAQRHGHSREMRLRRMFVQSHLGQCD